jgi:hypothetical protein
MSLFDAVREIQNFAVSINPTVRGRTEIPFPDGRDSKMAMHGQRRYL